MTEISVYVTTNIKPISLMILVDFTVYAFLGSGVYFSGSHKDPIIGVAQYCGMQISLFGTDNIIMFRKKARKYACYTKKR